MVKNEPGYLAYITASNNIGRVRQILVEHHLGGYNIVHIKDSQGKTFATRSCNAFVIGNKKSFITLPGEAGNYFKIVEKKTLRDNKNRKPIALLNDRCLLNSLPISFKLKFILGIDHQFLFY
jgi:hypothetical protein